MSSKFTFDTKKFSKDFKVLTLLKYPKATESGIRTALMKLKLDADNISPKTPHRGGDLKATTSIKTKIKAKDIEGTLTFEMPYAAYQHAGMRADGSYKIVNYKGGGTGAGFVSKKMVRFYKKYMKIIVLKIRAIKGI